MIFGGEVDVVLVSLRVDTGFEVDRVDIVVVPPVPGDFARFDPGGVAQLRGLFEEPDERIGDQVSITFGHSEYAPGKRARAFRDSDVVGGFGDFEVAVSFKG